MLPMAATRPFWIQPALTAVGRGFLELVFPPACAGCGRTISCDDGDWCMPCASRLLESAAATYCQRCGAAVGEFLFDASGCPACRQEGSWPDGFVRVGTYHDLVGQTLRRFKFNREHRLDRCLAGLLADAIQGRGWPDCIDVLVPVPTDWSGRFRYRCWPVQLLALQVSRRLGIPVRSVLGLKGKRRRQVGLPESERARNVRGVFRLRRRSRIEDARVCIVDDVSTTGSTIREVTRVLRSGGAAAVYAAVVARTDARRGDHDPL